MRIAGLLALFVLAACAGGPATPPRPVVEVLPPTGVKPHRLTAAAIPADGGAIREALAIAGLSLREQGGRDRLRIRYSPLDSKAESYLLDLFSIGDEAFSEPMGFGPADAIRIRSVDGAETPIGFTLHLLPRMERGAFSGFAAGALVRPRRGTLLPVLRGDVLTRQTGSVLLVGETGEEPLFACVLRTEIAGTDQLARLEVPSEHRISIEPFRVRTVLLTSILNGASLPVTGRSLSVLPLSPELREAVAESLALAGDRESPIDVPATSPFRLGRARISADPVFDPGEYGYHTKFTRKGAPASADHSVQDSVLLIVWDGAGRETSYAALIRIHPIQ